MGELDLIIHLHRDYLGEYEDQLLLSPVRMASLRPSVFVSQNCDDE